MRSLRLLAISAASAALLAGAVTPALADQHPTSDMQVTSDSHATPGPLDATECVNYLDGIDNPDYVIGNGARKACQTGEAIGVGAQIACRSDLIDLGVRERHAEEACDRAAPW
jgi:hypothetical protein